jgi:hypothetical protein
MYPAVVTQLRLSLRRTLVLLKNMISIAIITGQTLLQLNAPFFTTINLLNLVNPSISYSKILMLLLPVLNILILHTAW